MNKKIKIRLICPWCFKGEALSDGKADVTISIKCCKCGKIFTGNLNTLKTEKGKALKRTG